jgi:hypothetical protein
MGSVPVPLNYLLISWSAVTAVLIVLVIYGNTLSMKEDDELYLNRAEQTMMASQQQTLIAKMRRLSRIITGLAVGSGILLLTSAAVWVWIGWTRN